MAGCCGVSADSDISDNHAPASFQYSPASIEQPLLPCNYSEPSGGLCGRETRRGATHWGAPSADSDSLGLHQTRTTRPRCPVDRRARAQLAMPGASIRGQAVSQRRGSWDKLTVKKLRVKALLVKTLLPKHCWSKH